MLSVSIAQPSSGLVAICYVVLIWWMISCFHATVSTAACRYSISSVFGLILLLHGIVSRSRLWTSYKYLNNKKLSVYSYAFDFGCQQVLQAMFKNAKTRKKNFRDNCYHSSHSTVLSLIFQKHTLYSILKWWQFNQIIKSKSIWLDQFSAIF